MSDHQRSEPSRIADERSSLAGFLDYQRQTLAMKCSGLTAEQLRQKAVPPSAISLLGLVRHLADVERWWFQNVINGEQFSSYWGRRPDGQFADFDVDKADPGEAFDIWHAACTRSRGIVDAAENLDIRGHHSDEDFSLRYVLTHMIEEYARHNGHADLLRERIDGATGQ
ncbi:DinB family protein [Streptomyces sp. CG1]|uniref:DinB family protein n=1 Tax=Streptomyces sp. CG1 TaxID=1287523 RepID=UPI0034E30184